MKFKTIKLLLVSDDHMSAIAFPLQILNLFSDKTEWIFPTEQEINSRKAADDMMNYKQNGNCSLNKVKSLV